MSQSFFMQPVQSECFNEPRGEGTLLSLSPERLLRGQPERRDWPVFERADGKVSTGIWSGTAGAWRIDFREGQFEFFHVLSGIGAIVPDEGERKPFGPGDAVMVPEGFRGVFEVTEKVTKQYMFVQNI
jgi:uncharacterized cupin superfamily protein